MRQFDVYENPAASPGRTPFVVVLTSHHLALETVLVAPLVARRLPVEDAELAVSFRENEYVLSLVAMAAVHPKRLRRLAGSIADQEEPVRRAVHRLFTGF